MKIEIESQTDGITITDCTIRDYPIDFSEENVKEPHFQARFDAPQIEDDDSICGSFSYFSCDGEFLGLDSDAEWVSDITLKEPYTISFRIYPPVNTELVKCQLGIRKPEKTIWNFAWPSFVGLAFILLLSSIVNIWL